MRSDPIVDEIHRRRAELSATHGDDLERIVQTLQHEERTSGRTVMQPPQRRKPLEAASGTRE